MFGKKKTKELDRNKIETKNQSEWVQNTTYSHSTNWGQNVLASPDPQNPTEGWTASPLAKMEPLDETNKKKTLDRRPRLLNSNSELISSSPCSVFEEKKTTQFFFLNFKKKKGWLICGEEAHWYEFEADSNTLFWYTGPPLVQSVGTLHMRKLLGSIQLSQTSITILDASSPQEKTPKIQITFSSSSFYSYFLPFPSSSTSSLIIFAETLEEHKQWYSTLSTAPKNSPIRLEVLSERFFRSEEPQIIKYAKVMTSLKDNLKVSTSINDENEIILEKDWKSIPITNGGPPIPIRNLIGSLSMIVLLRHAGCIFTKQTLKWLNQSKPDWEKLGISLIIIGHGTPTQLKLLQSQTQTSYPIYCSAEPKNQKKIYKLFGTRNGYQYCFKEATLLSLKRAIDEGHTMNELEGDPFQLGGVFLCDSSYNLFFQRVEQYSGDHPDRIAFKTTLEKFLHHQKDLWTSVLYKKDWKELEAPPRTEWNFVKNIQGYHIEWGKTISSDVKIEIDDKNKDFLPFKEEFFFSEHSNFFFKNSENVIVAVLSVKKDEKKDENKAILRLEEMDHRFFIPIMSKKDSDIINYVKTVWPNLIPYKAFKIKSDRHFIQKLEEFENINITRQYKFGLLYWTDDSCEEHALYANTEDKISSNMKEFMKLLGDTIVLKNFSKFAGGLDTKHGGTGTYSLYTTFEGYEIHFHTSVYLPFTPTDLERIERKKFIGNDIVVIIFKETNTLFDPTVIKSHFNHVFALVSPHDSDFFKVCFVNKESVKTYRPYLPPSGLVKKTDFRNFFLTKLINGERASIDSSPQFKLVRAARRQLLESMGNGVPNSSLTLIKTPTMVQNQTLEIDYKSENEKLKRYVSQTKEELDNAKKENQLLREEIAKLRNENLILKNQFHK